MRDPYGSDNFAMGVVCTVLAAVAVLWCVGLLLEVLGTRGCR